MKKSLVFSFLVAVLLVPLQTLAASATVSVKQVHALLKPVFADPAADKRKLHKPEQQQERLKVPTPALLLFFGEGGCLTAVIGPSQLEAVDHQCFPTSSAPTLSSFSGIDASVTPVILMLSPIADVEALKLEFPGRDEYWERELENLRMLELQLRERFPGTAIQVANLPFGS